MLASPDLLAVNALGQFIHHPRISALRDYVARWHAEYRAALSARDGLTAVLLFMAGQGGKAERIAADVQKAL